MSTDINISELKKSFGNKVKYYRKKKNITQEQLSEIIGLTPKYISKLENGYSLPKIETLLKLCITLDIDLNSLFINYLPVIPKQQLKSNLAGLIDECNDNAIKEIISFTKFKLYHEK